MISIKKLKKSFSNAFLGIKSAFTENTFRILFIIAFVVSFCIGYFPFEPTERAILILVVAVVLSLELINSQIERVLNILKPDYNKEVRKIKDISAGAVLVISIGAVAVGVLLTLPYIIDKFL